MQFVNTISNTRTWNRHGTKIIWALALLCLLIVLASITWDFYKQHQTKIQNYAPQNIQPITRRQTESYNANTIVRANLFGDSTPKPVAVNAKPTTLNLTLQGILAATDNQLARAIITSGNKKAGLYSIGEDIQGVGASVKEIRSDEVLLNRNGAVESLKIKKKSGGGNSIISYNDSRPHINAPRASAASIQSQQQTGEFKNRSENGEPRKIRKPNFSGLDRALQKMGEI